MIDPDSQQALEQLQREHALFLRTAAHSLRTPLQSLLGFAELLEPGLPPALADHYIGFIKRDAVYLAGVVDDLCLRDELARGPLSLFPVVVEVEPMLGNLARAFEARLPDCLIVLDYPDSLPAVYADVDRLCHVLWTLLRNAERCRPEPGRLGALSVSVRHVVEERRVVFSVRDDGVRIPAGQVLALFEPLAHLPIELGRPRLGIGLGLHVAREVARQMGGNLWLAPETGADSQYGNDFLLALPVFEGQVGHA